MQKMIDGIGTDEREDSSEDLSVEMSDLLREIGELKESIRLERSKNLDCDSKFFL